jgi:hypothetical protein
MHKIRRASHFLEVRFLDSRKHVILIHRSQINSARTPENKYENPHYGKGHPGPIVILDSLKRNLTSLLAGVWDCGIKKVLVGRVFGGFWTYPLVMNPELKDYGEWKENKKVRYFLPKF